jgi:HEAT repeat protein
MEKWLALALAFLATVFVCLMPLLPRAAVGEAVHQGKATSSWEQQLRSSDPEFRREAARALGQMGPEAKEAVPSLMAALKDEDRAVRIQAAHALGEIGPEAKAAVPALRESMVTCKDGAALRHTLAALRRIDGRQPPS